MIESILLAWAAVAMPTAQAAPAPACTSPLPASRVEGSWTGQFAQVDWTFELTEEGGAWSGRYMSSRRKGWQPLQSLAVAGGCATFSIKSTPQLIFALSLGADGDTLAGDLRIEGRVTLPFSAVRNR